MLVGLFVLTNAWSAYARKSAAEELASIHVTKAGVDAKNNFWAWDAKRRVVTRVTPNGDRFESDILPNAWSIDAEPERGIAVLSEGGRGIEIRGWNGSRKRSIRLLHSATDIAWLSGSHIAVTPQTTGPCVEIWDASTGEYLSGFGACPDITTSRPGVFPARATLLRYDPAHREIVTFDAFRCDLIAFSETGSITRKSHVQHPKAAEFDAWVKKLDANAQAHRQSSVPVIRRYASMTIAPDRSVLLGESADGGGLTSVAILGDGTVQRTRIEDAQCPSIRFVAWGDDLVLYRDQRLPQPVCIELRRR
ncbi:MAG TPA: hypothetical protein VNN08_24550 [Thermoanaerobaculia bacterium]|nr:hypothetical protein [Thermoanaerobaculia bacterium]